MNLHFRRSDMLGYGSADCELDNADAILRSVNWPNHVHRWCLLKVKSGLLLRIEATLACSRVPLLWQDGGDIEGRLFRLQCAIENEILPELEALFYAQKWRGCAHYDLILSAPLAAQFVHECIGHTLEVDNYENYGRSAGFELGRRISSLPLTVVDDPTVSGHVGSFKIDDQGEVAHRVNLVSNGFVTNLLGGKYSARARRVSGAKKCLPRMSITWMEKGSSTLEELVRGVEDGWLCFGTWGGGSLGDKAILRPCYAQRIHHGEVTNEFIRRFDIIGLKLLLTKSIDGIGNDFKYIDPVMGCDKEGQDNLPVTLGSPSVRIRGAKMSGY